MKNIYRQGDVLLVPAQAIPVQAKPQTHLTLAYGEVTGHSHRFAAGSAATFFRPDDAGPGGGWLEVRETALLEHEEHTALAIPPGLYRVAVQVEETPEAIRRVED